MTSPATSMLIGLDPQNGGASHHLGVDENRSDPEADNLVRHLIDRPKGEFDDLVHKAAHGIHVIPSHNMLDSLETHLQRAQEMEQDMGGRFVKELQLQNVLRDAGVPEKYDVGIIDPPGTGGLHVYNAVSATGDIVIPLELSPKGEQSLYGLEDTVSNLEAETDTEIGVVAVVPNKVRRTRVGDKYQKVFAELSYPVAPTKIPIRGAILNGAWDAQTTAYEFVIGNKWPDRERETLEQFNTLARFIAEQFDDELTKDDINTEETEVVAGSLVPPIHSPKTHNPNQPKLTLKIEKNQPNQSRLQPVVVLRPNRSTEAIQSKTKRGSKGRKRIIMRRIQSRSTAVYPST